MYGIAHTCTGRHLMYQEQMLIVFLMHNMDRYRHLPRPKEEAIKDVRCLLKDLSHMTMPCTLADDTSAVKSPHRTNAGTLDL